MFRNEDSIEPISHIGSIFNGAAIRYVHFHDYIPNVAFLGGFDGKLSALVFQDDTDKDNQLIHELHSIFTTDESAAITTIRTSKIHNQSNVKGKYYV